LVDAAEALVAVHDGVRPFVSHAVMERCYQDAAMLGAVVPVVPVVETVRQIVGEASVTVDRNAYRLVQTPQTFRASLLRRAYEQPYCDAFTDDASVVEALGEAVHLVEGNRENIKLTTPFDLTVARALVEQEKI
jgi:2-C-methyl-D-erythritol 4-phosphate cytidylyltransferase